MKKIIFKFLTVFTVLSMCSPLVIARDYPQRFWDVSKSHWAFEYISDLAERKVLSGYEDGSFKPNRTVSRAEWARIMVDAAAMNANDTTQKFTDVKSDYWAAAYINAASDYLTGYKDGTFRPNQSATREDVTISLVLVKGYDISDVDYSVINFRDMDSISNYAKAYVAVAIENNLISGFEDNTFRGQDTLTRAEAATLLFRAFQHGSADKVVGTPNITTSDTKTDTEIRQNEYIKQAEPSYSSGDDISTSSDIKQSEKDTVKATLRTKAKAEISSPYLFTSTDNGDVYYLEDNSLFICKGAEVSKHSLSSVVDSNCELVAIAVNDGGDRCAIQYRNKDTDKYIMVDTTNFEVITGILDITFLDNEKLMKIDSDNLITSLRVVSINSGEGSRYFPEPTHWVLDRYRSLDVNADGINLLYAYEKDNDVIICSYDYVNSTEIGTVNVFALGLQGDSLYYLSSKGFHKIDYEGNELYSVNFSDMNVTDKLPIDSYKIARKLLVTKNGIIFYDTSYKCFREVSFNA